MKDISVLIKNHLQQLPHVDNNLHRKIVDVVEDEMISKVMEYAQGNETLTARILGINRGTLRKKLMKFEANRND